MKAGATAAELDAADRRTIGIAMDVTNEEQVDVGMDAAVEASGRIDVTSR